MAPSLEPMPFVHYLCTAIVLPLHHYCTKGRFEMTMLSGHVELMVDVFPKTSGVKLGGAVWDIEPLAIPRHMQLAFASAFETESTHELSVLYVDHGAELIASGRVKRLSPTILVEVTDVRMPEGEPRDFMEI